MDSSGTAASSSLRSRPFAALASSLSRLLGFQPRHTQAGPLTSSLSHQSIALAEASAHPLLLIEPVPRPGGQAHDFRIAYANRHFHRLLQDPARVLVELELAEALPFLAGAGTLQQYHEALQGKDARACIVAVQDPNVTATWLRIAIAPFEGGLLLTLQDLSAARQMERQLCQQIQHDALTGLPNRTLLDDRIQQALRRARRNSEAAAVLLLDLDDLKSINRKHGRDAGDHVLKTVATRLTDAVRSTDSVLRLGGDEFVIVFPDVFAHGPITDFARKIVLRMFAPILWEDVELHVTASIGVAMYPAAGTTPEALLVQADLEMNRMKRAHCPPAPNTLSESSGSFSLNMT